MIIWVYDKWGNQKRAIKWVNNFVHDDELGNLDFIEFILIGETLEKYDYLVWRDEFGEWHEHFVREITLVHNEGTVVQKVYAVNSISELNLSYIGERDSYNFKNSVAWTRLLENTRWTPGTIDDMGLGTVKFYHETVYDGVIQIMELWGGDLSTTITVGSSGVTERRVNHQKKRGQDNGLLFTYGFDMDNIERKVELDDVYTKIHVFGKGEPTYGEDGTQTGNGRRITFESINGGKDYVEDNVAKEKWGIQGKNGWQHSEGTFVFENCEDKAELLALAREKLEEVKQPRIVYSANVAILKAAGMEFKNARTGDTCYIRDKVIDERLSGRIIHVRRFFDDSKPAEITLGNIVRTVNDVFKETKKQLSSLQNQTSKWDDAAEANRQWLQNMKDHLNEMMNDTGGFAYWDEGEGITVYDRKRENNPTMAIQLKGAGFRIANSKNSDGSWNWRTFGTGDGFTADVINVGTLRCGENVINLDSGLVTFKNGVIQDMYSMNYLNLGTGEFRLAFNTKVGDKTVTQIAQETVDAEVNNFVSQVYDPKIADLQKQIDGQIETWYYDYEPKLTNKPASDWNTEAKKEAHEGDLFYWKSKGYAYRFFKDGSTWKWDMVQDTDITRALAGAAAAQDTADSKRRVFVSQPTPPYDIGDLWTQGTNGDLMRCQVARQSGSYVSTDWIKATKYTDDSGLTAFINGTFQDEINSLQSQADEKAETWYQTSDPSTAWKTTAVKNEHIGDLWYNPNNNEYKRWNGTAWESMPVNPPQAVFDSIDGKAQIFVAQPKPPYQIGDLWVQGETGDILRCQTNRKTGNYVSGDWIKASKYTDDSSLNNWVNNTYAEDLKDVNNQIDQKIETWYQSTDPSTSWTTTAIKNEHKGDLWFNTTKNEVKRWSGTAWVEMEVDPPQAVFDSIDGKAQIFISQPKPPYSQGDLWFNSASADIMTCIVARESGSYNSADWQKRNKYTDDSALDSFIKGEFSDLETQVDGKVETWAQTSDPSTSWNTTALKNQHKGDLWFNTQTGVAKRWSGTTWVEMTTNPPKGVFDTIDGKAQIFTGDTNPKPPYSVGDLWFKDNKSDILTCVNSRSSGSYNSNDWSKQNKYIDQAAADSAASSAVDAQTQTDIFNKLTDDGKAKGLFLEENELYINADYIQTGILTSSGGSQWNLTTGDFKTIFTLKTTQTSTNTSSTTYSDDIIQIEMGETNPFAIYKGTRKRTYDKKTGKTTYDLPSTKSFLGGIVRNGSNIYFMADRVGQSNERYITTGITNDDWTGFTFQSDYGTVLQVDDIRNSTTPSTQVGTNGVGFSTRGYVFLCTDRYSKHTYLLPPTQNNYSNLQSAAEMLYMKSGDYVMLRKSTSMYLNMSSTSGTALTYSDTKKLLMSSGGAYLVNTGDTNALHITSGVAALYATANAYMYVNSSGAYLQTSSTRGISITSSGVYVKYDDTHFFFAGSSQVTARCGNYVYGCWNSAFNSGTAS